MNFKEVQVELLGTFAISYLTMMGRITDDLNNNIYTTQTAIIAFFATLAFILIGFPATKCNFTPIITLADAIFNKSDMQIAFIIMLTQLVGTFLAIGLIVIGLTDNQIDGLLTKSQLGFPYLRSLFDSTSGFFAQLIFSSVLVFLYLTLTNRKTAGKNWVEYYAVMRAILVGVASFAAESICSLTLNPFETLAGALISTHFKQYQWIYFVPPIIGITIGGLAYNSVGVRKFFTSLKEKTD